MWSQTTPPARPSIYPGENPVYICIVDVYRVHTHTHTRTHRYFPKIFGPKENEPLNKKASLDALEGLTTEVNV